MHPPQSLPEFNGELLIASLADWLAVQLVELGFGAEALIAGRAGEMMLTPGLVQCRYHCNAELQITHELFCYVPIDESLIFLIQLTIAGDNLIADKAKIPK